LLSAANKLGFAEVGFAFDWNMLSSSSPEESHESPPEWLKEKTIG